MKHFFFALLLTALSSGDNSIAQTKENTIKIQFSNIRNGKGTLRLGVFKTQAEFDKEKPYKKFVVSKSSLSSKSLTAMINLPNGTYGISVLDDENENDKMDYNIIKMPVEGFGFSNYYHSGFSKPKLSQFLITVNNGDVLIKCKLRYI